MRLVLLLAALAAAIGLAVATSQSPRPAPLSTPVNAFSAERAMPDVRRIAARPHPVGTLEHALVQAYLLGRMTDMGLAPTLQAGVLSPAAIARMERRGDDARGLRAVNIVGVLPGRDPALPAVALMAHYDSVPGSPGAADDASGVAAVLEAVRAIQARGPADRTLIVLLTDAEELNLDGARAFFSEHPLRDRIGAVVNLEARGGGGRAMMFETGAGNAQTIAEYSKATRHATGGPSSNALAVFVYRLMPNGTDFTVAAQRGLAGVNFAFIGRPAQYHSPTSTPDALDQGSLQHIGSQALETADRFLRAEALPQATRNSVYADVFGLVVLRHPPQVGWLLLALAGGLTGFAAWGARHARNLRWRDVGTGAADGLWLLTTGAVLAQATRVLGGPIGGRVDSPETYYTLLRRLPWMEAGVALALLAAALLVLAGRGRIDKRVTAALIVGAAALGLGLGGFDPVLAGAGILAVGLTFWPRVAAEDRTGGLWGGWLGLIVLVLIFGAVAQGAAPEAAFLLTWTALAASMSAAASALIGARLEGWRSLLPPVIATAGVGGWLLAQGHGIFLGVGMDLPGALVLIALLILMLARPLAPVALPARRTVAATAAAALLLGCGLSLAGRAAEPPPPADAAPIP